MLSTFSNEGWYYVKHS